MKNKPLFLSPVRFCKGFSGTVIRNELYAMGYYSISKIRHISTERLLELFPRHVLSDLAHRLKLYREASVDEVYRKMGTFSSRTPTPSDDMIPWGG